MTPEELDKARAAEAWRVWEKVKPSLCEDNDVALFAARLAREGWTPVDSDLLAVREIAAAWYERRGLDGWAHSARNGELDAGDYLQYALTAYKAGKEAGK